MHHDVATSAVLQARCPAVAEAAASIGDPQVRNRGTIGGSVAHADPSADMPAVLLALDAEIHLKGPRGWRMVKASDFFQDLFRVDMRADEIIASVQFVPVRAAAYAKLHQRASHYAIVGVAASLEVSGGTIVSARVGVTGATSHATRLSNVERALAGQPLSSATIDRAAQMAAAGAGRGERGPPRQRGVPSCDGSGVRASRRCRPRWLGCRRRLISTIDTKKRSSIIFETPPIRRWPRRAIGPPVCTVPVTSTMVVAPSARSVMAALPFTNPGRPLPSAVRRYDVCGTRSDSVTMPSYEPVIAASATVSRAR